MTERKRRGQAGSPAPGIREIAEILGVSIGTVDRALHDRPGISPATRHRVLRTAETLGYRPNLAARYLSSGRELRVGVVLPLEIHSFWGLVRDGIRSAAGLMGRTGVRLLDRPHPRLGQGDVEAIEHCLDDGVRGLLLAPGEPDLVAPLIERARDQGVPVVCVNTDAPGTSRLCGVSVDPLTNGALVGELMGRFLKGEGPVALVTGLLKSTDHSRKVEGFRRTTAELWPDVQVADVIEAHDDEEEAYRKCRALFAAHDHLRGIYVSTANSLPVLQAIEDEGLGGRLTVITTDLFPALAPHVQSGRVAATIYQRPWTQGRIAFEVLSSYLAEGRSPASCITLSPQIVMKSNLPLFLDRMAPRAPRPPELHTVPVPGA